MEKIYKLKIVDTRGLSDEIIGEEIIRAEGRMNDAGLLRYHIEEYKESELAEVFKITDQRREDMIVGALEGGSNYWYWIGEEACRIMDKACIDHKEPFAIRFWKTIQAGKTLPVHDIEDIDNKLGDISLQSIEEGERLMIVKYPKHYLDIINEEDDAITADVWFQFCTLKNLIYG